MFPQFRERMGSALDLIVEFSTLGEYRLAANGAVRPASALIPVLRRCKHTAPEREPQLGGAGPTAERAAVRRPVAGGAAGLVPAATPAARRGACRGERRRSAKPAAPEQLCLAV